MTYLGKCMFCIVMISMFSFILTTIIDINTDDKPTHKVTAVVKNKIDEEYFSANMLSMYDVIRIPYSKCNFDINTGDTLFVYVKFGCVCYNIVKVEKYKK